ncbi:MAG: NAD(P)-dependent oxidoreductase [Stenotrophomonas sp.]|uniref:NAD(P)-dependent oxidoreductase n=1 Tax=unclassified Stenotrophomonas TaxID=196198 RepID=UPI001782B8EC|nr:NAD(P)H-binding protein [Stenotrophomonas sp. STM01]MBD9536372.1 NAD(P)H-binding protein [Stenotrophomonas sp. STM01]
MKVALIGATGFVGQALLEELLARGHDVTALARHPEKLAAHPHLRTVKADAQDAAQVQAAVAGNDAVISAFNAGWSNPDIYRDFMSGTRAIVAGTKAAGVKRYIVIGGAGSLYAPDGTQLVDSPNFPAAIFDGANAARDALNELQQETTLDWTQLSPPVAFHGGGPTERTGRYRVGGDTPLNTGDGVGTISPADLALAVVDELETPKHVGKRFTIAW